MIYEYINTVYCFSHKIELIDLYKYLKMSLKLISSWAVLRHVKLLQFRWPEFESRLKDPMKSKMPKKGYANADA